MVLQTQRPELDAALKDKIRNKLANVHQKGYIAQGYVYSLMSYSAVPKGEHDIRMVYDASALGLNDCLWATAFSLSSADYLLDLLSTDSWMGDLDMGEQFLNFPLHPRLQEHFGIDLRPYFMLFWGRRLWVVES